MTARPPEPLHQDPLSPEERRLAEGLARLGAAAGPSAALDARILGAARTAAGARPARRVRWPRTLGAAAVLVAAVGLAWQLRPMFELPPPLHREHAGAGPAGVQSDVVVQVEPVEHRASPPAVVAEDAVAPAVQAAAPRRAAPAPGGTPPAAKPAARMPKRAPAAPRVHDFADEAVPPTDARTAAAVEAPVATDAQAAAAPAPPAVEPAARASARREAAPADTPRATGIDRDARLPLRRWLDRIRQRRDAGDLPGARASLARFMATYPNARIPADLRPLMQDDPRAP